MKIKVTIGVCLINCEKDIKLITKRLENQDFFHNKMEVIFVVSKSEDNTLSELKYYAPRMNLNYKIIECKESNLGLSRNIVLNNARGDYLVWVDDGTILPKNYIRKHIEIMESNSNIGITSGILDIYHGSNKISIFENLSSITDLRNLSLLDLYEKCKGIVTTKLPGTSGSVYRINAAKQVGGFDERIKGALEDTDIAYRIMSKGWKIYRSPIRYFRDYNTDFKKVYLKKIWYGYGCHFISHKHKGLSDILMKSTPIAGFFQGIILLNVAYRITHRKIAFLLPVYFSLIRAFFCLGFLKSHFDSYGH